MYSADTDHEDAAKSRRAAIVNADADAVDQIKKSPAVFVMAD
jgi:hypothetical protein